MNGRFLAVVGCGVFATVSTEVLCQSVNWSQPERFLPGEYQSVKSVRELSDGSLIVSDLGENKLVLISADGKSHSPIARAGGGPSEYRFVGSLFALKADTTVMPDASNGRWLVLVRGSPISSGPVNNELVRAVGRDFLGMDTLGGAYAQRAVGRISEGNGFIRDSIAVQKFEGTSTTPFAIAALRGVPYLTAAASNRNPMASRAFGVELTAPEQAVVFPDGVLAAVHLQPLRVDWYNSRGQVFASVPVSASRMPVSDRMKREHAARLAEAAGRPIPVDNLRNWPEYADPIDRNAIQADFFGRAVLLMRETSGDTLRRLVVVGRRRHEHFELQIPRAFRVVGFGRGRVYAVQETEEGMERLMSFRWPGP